MASCALLTLTLVLQLVAETTCVLDFTCFNNNPRISINGDNDLFIGGYKSGDDTGATVTFGRTSYTDTGNGLPPNSYEESHGSNPATLLKMLSTGGRERIGAFYCEAQKGEEHERITTIIMDQSSEVTPTLITQTVNTGDPVTFKVTQSYANLRWRHNGGGFISGLNGQRTYTIQSINVNDAGIYECHRNKRRGEGKHAIMQLIVRACQADKWGDSCQQTCPYCYNGVICNDKSGECVCAPGFSGHNCETAHGRNKWGQDGQLRCSGTNDHGDGCRGKLLCLPHPYGCSCAAGYRGIDCDIECTNGFYGANCLSQCHCAADVTCLKDTGECDGQCDMDWHGVNCQELCPVPDITISGLQASASDNIISLTWEPDPSPCTHSISYRVQYQLTNRDQCSFTTNENAESFLITGSGATINNLEYHSTYWIYVTAYHKGQQGSQVRTSITTGQAEPDSPPESIEAYNVVSKSFGVRWDKPQCGSRNGPILSYTYSLTRNSDGKAVAENTTELKYVTFDELTPFSNYTFQIAVMTEAGRGPKSTIVVMTNEAVPSVPDELQVIDVNQTSIDVTWGVPVYPNGVIDKYMVQVFVKDKPYDPTFTKPSDPEFKMDVTSETMTYTFNGLKPSTKYELRVQAATSGGPGDSAILEQSTDPVLVTDIPTPMMIDARSIDPLTSTTAEIQIPVINHEYVSGYLVGVEEVTSRRKRQTNEFGHYDDSPTKYIAAELSKSNDSTFIVGDNKTYGIYYNAPLMEEVSYQISTAYFSRINETMSVISWSNDAVPLKLTGNIETGFPLWIPIIAIIVVVALFVVAVAVILIKRKQQRESIQRSPSQVLFTSGRNAEPTEDQPPNLEDESFHGATNNTYVDQGEVHIPRPPPPSLASHHTVVEAPPAASKQVDPIALDMFEEYVLTKKEGAAGTFAADFRTLPGDDLFSWLAAKKKENVKKNRYKNITTYDNSRVKLMPREDDPHSDYINASFIDGVYDMNKYIASQGPNTESVDDFWRMILQYKIKKVVMLTMLVESGKIKCQQYWPSEKVVKGGITITPNKEEHFAHFIIRRFRIEQVSSSEVREFRQFHFISWPDMSVPECPALINFMNVVNSYEPTDNAPPVIHCSAGVGRTGTYIAIDAMREQAKRDRIIDVYDFVSKMRQKRMKMVQTTAQYRFIFDTLVEYIHCGDTLIERVNFNSELKKLRSKDQKSGLKKQFQTLQKVTEWPSDDKCKVGLDPSNRNKNRFQDIIPLDRCRPILTTELEGGTNYIHGAYVDGCRFKDQFLVTQTPLPETVADIWRMVNDHNSNAIVMLNELDSNDPTTIKYWPDVGSTAHFEPITVKGGKEDTRSVPGVVVRTFHITNQREKGKRTVHQFVLDNWPAGKDSPSKPDTLLDLINCLKQYYEPQKLQRITVHCIDGVGASCVFCTIMSVIDQLQYNQTIDIFHIIRRIRMARPQAVRNLAQYTFCYKTIQTYLQSTSDVYENFNQQQEPADDDDAQIYVNVNTDGTPSSDGQIYANV